MNTNVRHLFANLTASTFSSALLLLGLLMLPGHAEGSEANGISVSRPKLYDSRTLQIMLEQLDEQLKTVRAVDQQKLTLALGNRQGAEVSDVIRSLSLTTPLTPEIMTKETVSEDGGLTPSEKTTKQAALTPSAPDLAELIAAPAYSPSVGSSAEDLLSNQVSLSYQIFNIRMLLERSLTDRVWGDEPRLQAVLGFQVSLDPPNRLTDHAAFVEVKIEPSSCCSGPISLVAMMPFEKTYNSSALSTKANDFGGSVVAKVLTLGYRDRRRSQIFYLFRDADTLAMETLSDPALEVATFGWTFRPVLGRRSVTPGVRQLFAVVALPEGDVDEFDREVKCTVRTYWRRYKRSTLTTKAKEKDLREWPKPAPLKIYSSEKIEAILQPKIHTVDWSTTGDDEAVVTVRGKNFFPGTRVLLGNSVHDGPSSGLVLKSDRTLELKTTVRALAFGDAVLSGRYGPAARFEDSADRPSPNGKCRSGILINKFWWKPEPGRKLIAFDLVLQDREGGNLELRPEDRPLLTIGDQYIPGPYQRSSRNCEIDSNNRTCWQFKAWMSQELLGSEAIVQIRFPFRGPTWTDQQFSEAQNRKYQVFRLGGDDPVHLAIQGPDFNEEWTVRIDRLYKTTDPNLELMIVDKKKKTGSLLLLRLSKEALKNYKKLVLKGPDSSPAVLDIPDPKSKPAKPTINSKEPPSAKKGTASDVEFKGKNLNQIKCAWFGKEELHVKASPKGDRLTVYLSRNVTKELGPVVILLQAKGGTVLPAKLTILP